MQSRLVCLGCEAELPSLATSPLGFRCPNAELEPASDHLLVRRLTNLEFPLLDAKETNPYLRFRDLDHVYLDARGAGLSASDYAAIVRQLDTAVARIDGHGFSVTPYNQQIGLSRALGFSEIGGVWVKNETDNVSGSHKARHLFTVLVQLECIRRLNLAQATNELVIASCGNAALAAAVLARAAQHPLRIFVPEDAEVSLMEKMRNLGAYVEVCTRAANVLGDPTVHRFRESIRNGAIAFSCQGPDQALAVQGGKTIAWEMICSDQPIPDRIFVQVGGGALASSVTSTYEEALAMKKIQALPRFHAVQTRGCYPLVRAYQRLVDDIQRQHGWRLSENDELRSIELRDHLGTSGIHSVVHHAARNRSRYMEPWPKVPHSMAHGILDDETYDWLPVIRGMLLSAGYPILIDEPNIEDALNLAHCHTGIPVCATGVSSLAGLCVLLKRHPEVRNNRLTVLFSGHER